MIDFKDISLKSIEFLVKANFAVAVILVIVVAVLTLTDDSVLFEDNADLDLYGPLANNLRLILVYTAIAEVNIAWYCWAKQKQSMLLGVGLFYLAMIGGFEFYGFANQMPIEDNYGEFFLYQGISHVLYGGFYFLRRRKKR
jgi:hypothetical protein